MRTRIVIAASLLLLIVSSAWSVNPNQAKGGLLAASDGKGQIYLFWLPPLGKWPAGGWRVEDDKGQVLIARVAAAEPETLKEVSAEDAKNIRQFQEGLRSAKPENMALLYGLAGARAMSDPGFARALGVSRTLSNVPPGPRSYKVVGLDGNGQPNDVVLPSASVDSAVLTPLPPAPPNLRAEARKDGVALFWAPVPTDRKLPVASYFVERDSAGQMNVAVTPKPLILGLRWKLEVPTLTDDKAPGETDVTYRVSSVDLFGRKSAPAIVQLFVPDLAALAPPLNVRAAQQPGKVTVEWSPGDNPHTAGYIVERAYLHGGPYVAITPQALPARGGSYVDTSVRGGSAYFYRIRAMGPRGDLGDPSTVAKAQPVSTQKPPRPQGLVADAGTTRVRLSWPPVAFPVAGYVVERRAEGATNWTRLSSRVNPEPLYDDYFGLNTSGKLSYHVIAIGFDNQESEASNVVEADIPDTAPPGAPSIVRADGAGGKVVLALAPALPEAKTQQFLVLRGGSNEDPGLVIGDPLPGTARQFEDSGVAAGGDYWYRVVAVAANGTRSAPSRAVVVRVGNAELPAPPQPTAEYQAKPFPQVKLHFPAPPEGLSIVVQRRSGTDGSWLTLTGPSTAADAVDANPPSAGDLSYRIVYRSDNDSQGPPSPEVRVPR